MFTRRTALSAAALAALPSAWAQNEFPSRPLRLIVPLQAGGIADVAARAAMLELEKKLGQPIIVDNKPGGQFLIAIQALQAAPADGYTMLAINGGFCAIQTVTKLYDVQKAFTPVSINAEAQFSLIVSGKSPLKTFAEFLDFARKNPNKLNYAIPGIGTMEHMKNAQLAIAAGFAATAIPYKNGGPDMVKGVIGGEVDYTICPTFLAKMFTANGAVRNLLIVHDIPSKDFPDVPTLPQANVKIDPLSVWGGYAVHNDTPPALIQRLHLAIAEVFKTPALIDKYTSMGSSVLPAKNPEQAKRFIASELAWMNNVLPALKLQ